MIGWKSIMQPSRLPGYDPLSLLKVPRGPIGPFSLTDDGIQVAMVTKFVVLAVTGFNSLMRAIVIYHLFFSQKHYSRS
jgi:hypothetical protein